MFSAPKMLQSKPFDSQPLYSNLQRKRRNRWQHSQFIAYLRCFSYTDHKRIYQNWLYFQRLGNISLRCSCLYQRTKRCQLNNSKQRNHNTLCQMDSKYLHYYLQRKRRNRWQYRQFLAHLRCYKPTDYKWFYFRQ